jgi:thioester reductase-like protein
VSGHAVLTGFPGFLGARLLPRILRRDSGLTATCIVQERFSDVAAHRVAQLEREQPDLQGRIDLVRGDITRPGLGLDDAEGLAARATSLWHLAAVYDLAVDAELAERVNVAGTRNVVRFAERCPSLARHHYVSTCYVSGRHCGPFREDDLDVGQAFNNHYEATKFRAELEVAASRDGGVPTTIYRPSIVVGDSRTGETQKFDGPYFLLQWLLRQRGVALVPVIGDPTMTRFNVVPSDYVVAGIDQLSALASSLDRTYQLADPAPLTVAEMVEAMCDVIGRRGIRVPLPRQLTRWALEHIGPLERFVGIPGAAVPYFAHPTHYDTANAVADLAGSGISCPQFADYLPNLVAFLESHRDADVGVMA